jgi:predicted RNase H-like nuclease (RuvC/YqgF family)
VTDSPDQGIQAIIAGAVLGALTWVASRRSEHKALNTPAPQPKHDDPPVIPLPASQSPEDVLKFMQLVQQDNASLRREVADVKRDNAHLQSTLDEMARDIAADKSWKVRFMDALGRYLSKLAHEWSGGAFPLPDGEDLITLQDIIPRS